MMALMNVDLTTVCVILLIITLLALWVYVAVKKETIQQPDFSVLHEAPQKPATGQPSIKKVSKSKGKPKMVDGSPKPSQVMSRGAQKKPSLAPTSTSSSKGKESQESRPTADHLSGMRKRREHRKQAGQEQVAVKGEQVQQKKRKISLDVPRGEEGSGKNMVEGQWQTQLSRPQLKALRQKQRHGENKRGQESGGNRPMPEAAPTQVLEGVSSLPLEVSGHQPVSLETTALQPVATKKGGKRSKSARHSSSLEEKTTSSSDDRASKEESSPDLVCNPDADQERHGSSSPELHTTTSIPDSDLETALIDAARSSVSSVDEDNTAPVTFASVTSTAAKKSKKRKKLRKKTKPVEAFTEPVKVAAEPADVSAEPVEPPVQLDQPADQRVEYPEGDGAVEQESAEAEVVNTDQDEWVFISADTL